LPYAAEPCSTGERDQRLDKGEATTSSLDVETKGASRYREGAAPRRRHPLGTAARRGTTTSEPLPRGRSSAP